LLPYVVVNKDVYVYKVFKLGAWKRCRRRNCSNKRK